MIISPECPFDIQTAFKCRWSIWNSKALIKPEQAQSHMHGILHAFDAIGASYALEACDMLLILQNTFGYENDVSHITNLISLKYIYKSIIICKLK